MNQPSNSVSYEISDGKIIAIYADGTTADFGDANEPFKSVFGRKQDGTLMVCTMTDEHWMRICDAINANVASSNTESKG